MGDADDLPVAARGHIDELLAGLATGERVRSRIATRAPGLLALLAALYPDAVDDVFARVLRVAAQGASVRPASLAASDVERELEPAWFQRNDQVGYAAYADRFGGTLAGVGERAAHLASMGVTYLHLMHVMRARKGDNDGGYAVIGHTDVEPSLGTQADLVALAERLHALGISLCLDVVLNHTAAEHPWAVAARAGSARHRAYYLTFTDRTDVDAFEATLPEVFPQIAPGSFTFDVDLDAWVWTTFHEYQWDLDYRNPDVLIEMVGIVLALANLGADVLRLDAIAFTWKRLGTNCQNQPEVHLLAQVLRAVLAIAAPGVLLEAEAIVGPSDLLPYLGAHRTQRDECQLAYHNQLMVDIWDALATGDARLASAALAALPPTPREASWVTYLRCHDDIGWAIDDTVAASVHIGGAAHRAHLAAFYRGDVDGSWARGVAFSTNPSSGDERTCGTAAALCGIGAACQPAQLDLAIARMLLGYSVVFAFGGIPLIYMGDEIAMDNDTGYRRDPMHRDDSRWIHRPAMDWAALATTDGHDVAGRVLAGMRHLVAARRATPALSGGGETW
ncbi:MAG: alpha-amylase family glycosyl hydrolase, partial [Ilumatobacteraceae bacterium]